MSTFHIVFLLPYKIIPCCVLMHFDFSQKLPYTRDFFLRWFMNIFESASFGATDLYIYS